MYIESWLHAQLPNGAYRFGLQDSCFGSIEHGFGSSKITFVDIHLSTVLARARSVELEAYAVAHAYHKLHLNVAKNVALFYNRKYKFNTVATHKIMLEGTYMMDRCMPELQFTRYYYHSMLRYYRELTLH